eukprot:COSAG01_NODE_45262_length_411_cov_0.387821_1_plen_89_part_00
MTGGRQAPAKKHGGQQGGAAAYAVDLVVTGKNISVLKAIKLTMERPGWRNAKGLSERNIYEQVAKRKKTTSTPTSSKRWTTCKNCRSS